MELLSKDLQQMTQEDYKEKVGTAFAYDVAAVANSELYRMLGKFGGFFMDGCPADVFNAIEMIQPGAYVTAETEDTPATNAVTARATADFAAKLKMIEEGRKYPKEWMYPAGERGGQIRRPGLLVQDGEMDDLLTWALLI